MKTPVWKKTAVIAAVVILPLIYSFFYLYAFWDPYSKLNELPVAVVNNDIGAAVSGQYKNIGNDLVDHLKGNDDVKWVFISSEESEKGLAERKYYAAVTIPEDFTQKIATAETTDKMKGVILYTLEEKRNFLAGQVLSRVVTSIRENVSQGITEAIADNMAEVMGKIPDQLDELGTGLAKIDDGAVSLKDGTKTLLNGQYILNNGIRNLNSGLESAVVSSKKLTSGSEELTAGLQKASEGSRTLTASMEKLSAGMTGYVAGQKQVNDSVVALNGALKSYIAHHPQAASDPELAAVVGGMAKISAGAPQLSAAAMQLEGGTKAASAGMASLSEGTVKAAEGMTVLNSGIGQFSEGIKAASAGSAKLLKGGNSLAAGAVKLNSGSGKLVKGINKAYDSVNDSATDASADVAKLNGIGAYAAEPVTVNENKINPVPDYGTAFTPYFVSLSIWVGALMMFFAIYLDPKMWSDRLTGRPKKAVRFLMYTFIGIGQALIVAFVLKNGLGLTVSNVGMYYAVILLISLSFVSIMRFLIVQLKDVGKFIAVLWLILQLTACGGTFPMELVPKFFQVINPYMPMTYSVNALREVISGIDAPFLNHNMFVLGATGLCFLTINVGCAILRDRLETKSERVENGKAEKANLKFEVQEA